VHLFSADIQGSLQEINNEKFNLIITAGVLEYVPIEQTVANLSRFLLPGGYFLNSPVKNNLVGKITGWFYVFKPYSRSRNTQAFTKDGFELVKLLVHWSFKELHIFKKHRNTE